MTIQRQGDEFFCSDCGARWAFEESPPEHCPAPSGTVMGRWAVCSTLKRDWTQYGVRAAEGATIARLTPEATQDPEAVAKLMASAPDLTATLAAIRVPVVGVLARIPADDVWGSAGPVDHAQDLHETLQAIRSLLDA